MSTDELTNQFDQPETTIRTIEPAQRTAAKVVGSLYLLAIGNHSFSERRRILNPNGICVMAGVGGGGWHDGMGMRLAGELNAYMRSRFVSEKFLAYIATLNKADLTILGI